LARYFRLPREDDNLNAVITMHDRLSITLLLFMAAVGIWGLWSFSRGGILEGSITGALIIGQILIGIQGALGLIIFTSHRRPADSVHILYGIAAFVTLPFVWSYVRERHPRQGLFFYSLAALFIMGLAIRGIATGS
jgi:hypothetical protein